MKYVHAEIWPHSFNLLEFEQNVRNTATEQCIQDIRKETKRGKILSL